MIRLFRYFVFLVALLFSYTQSSWCQFQPAPVEKSNQKILLQGKVYYIHKVKANQTLYSISRAYGVTVQDIAAANPSTLLEVISEGQTLKIPAISSLDEFSETYYGLTREDFIYHTVRSHQTIHYISKKYNVSKEDIYYYNPGSEEVIQVGQVIKVPKNPVSIPQQTLSQSDTSNTYTVKQGDTLYALSKRFGRSIAELIKVNPQLRWGLKTGMVLNLSAEQYPSAFDFQITDSLRPRALPKPDMYSTVECDSVLNNHTSGVIKIALLLPFHARELLALDTIANDSIRQSHPDYKFRGRGLSFTEFYEGFLLAIDSLQESGAKVSLFTYDTKSDTAQIDAILRELEIIRPHLIVGPIVQNNIQRVSDYSLKNNVPMILPLYNNGNQATPGNPNVIRMIPDFESEINQCADYLSQFHDKNIILIHNEDSLGSLRIKDFRETLFAYFSSRAAYDEALYKEIRVNDTMQQNLQLALRENMENLVFVVSTNEAYVSNIIGLLRINQSLGYSIDMFGLPIWKTFENLRIELLHQLNTVIYTPFYIDYDKLHTKQFLKRCRKMLGHEPYKTVNTGSGFNFTYLGYEAGMIFTSAFRDYGPAFMHCICSLKPEMPQSTYQFEWSNIGGYSNKTINFVRYNSDFEIEIVEFESYKASAKALQNEEIEIDFLPFTND